MKSNTLHAPHPMRLLIAIGIMIFTIARHGHAQILINDVFSGTNTAPTSLSASAVVLNGDTETASVGPGYTGTVSLGSGVIYTETMSINAAATPGDLVISGAGVAGLAGTFDATKTFTGISLAASTTYTFTLTKLSGINLNLLSATNFKISQGGSTIADTSTGTGLLGGVATNLLTLFGASNTATFTFTTLSGINTSQPIVFDVNGGTVAGLLGSSVTFTGGTLQAVPEPSIFGLALMGVLLPVGLRRFRSARANR